MVRDILYRMIHDFMLLLQELISEVSRRQKCPVNVGQILNGYTAVGIWSSRTICTEVIRVIGQGLSLYISVLQ
jgi:hypothetical protein